MQERADRVELITKHGFSDLVQASTFSTTNIRPETCASKILNGASSATQDSYGDISRMGFAEKVTTTVRAGVAIAARNASGTLSAFLKNQKNDAILFGGVAIIAGADFVPGVDVAGDVTFCIVRRGDVRVGWT